MTIQSSTSLARDGQSIIHAELPTAQAQAPHTAAPDAFVPGQALPERVARRPELAVTPQHGLAAPSAEVSETVEPRAVPRRAVAAPLPLAAAARPTTMSPRAYAFFTVLATTVGAVLGAGGGLLYALAHQNEDMDGNLIGPPLAPIFGFAVGVAALAGATTAGAMSTHRAVQRRRALQAAGLPLATDSGQAVQLEQMV